MKRNKEKGNVMHEIQRQTTQKTHSIKIASVIVDSFCKCPKCGYSAAELDEDIKNNKDYLFCPNCKHEEGELY